MALVALVALKLRMRGAIALAWVFSVIGIGDLVFATFKAIGAQMYASPLGWNWYILNFYVPMLIVGHVMIIRLLTRSWSTQAVSSRRVVT